MPPCLLLIDWFIAAIGLNGNLTFKHLFEGNKSLAATQAHFKETVMDDLQEMVIVLGVQFDKHVIFTRGKVAFYHLGDSFNLATTSSNFEGSFKKNPIYAHVS